MDSDTLHGLFQRVLDSASFTPNCYTKLRGNRFRLYATAGDGKPEPLTKLWTSDAVWDLWLWNLAAPTVVTRPSSQDKTKCSKTLWMNPNELCDNCLGGVAGDKRMTNYGQCLDSNPGKDGVDLGLDVKNGVNCADNDMYMDWDQLGTTLGAFERTNLLRLLDIALGGSKFTADCVFKGTNQPSSSARAKRSASESASAVVRLHCTENCTSVSEDAIQAIKDGFDAVIHVGVDGRCSPLSCSLSQYLLVFPEVRVGRCKGDSCCSVPEAGDQELRCDEAYYEYKDEGKTGCSTGGWGELICGDEDGLRTNDDATSSTFFIVFFSLESTANTANYCPLPLGTTEDHSFPLVDTEDLNITDNIARNRLNFLYQIIYAQKSKELRESITKVACHANKKTEAYKKLHGSVTDDEGAFGLVVQVPDSSTTKMVEKALTEATKMRLKTYDSTGDGPKLKLHSLNVANIVQIEIDNSWSLQGKLGVHRDDEEEKQQCRTYAAAAAALVPFTTLVVFLVFLAF